MKLTTPTIPLGSKVRDIYTRFEGVAVSYYQFLYGCAQYEIVPTALDKDGHPVKEQSFDEQRVELIEASAKPQAHPGKRAIPLGSKVRDTLTGFEGIATSYSEFVHGVAGYGISPASLHEGKPAKAFWFAEGRVELVQEGKPAMSKQADSKRPGGPQVKPTRA